MEDSDKQIINLDLQMMSPLLRLCLFFCAVLGSTIPALGEKPRFATIEISRAFEAYQQTVRAKEQIAAARKTLAQDPRHEKIKLLDFEVNELKLHVKNPRISENERREHYRRFMMKNYELVSLRKELKTHLDQEGKAINQGMVSKTNELLDEVRAAAAKIAEEQGFDYVFEVSGKTSSQLSPLIYIRNSTDLTDEVIAALNKDNSGEEVAISEDP